MSTTITAPPTEPIKVLADIIQSEMVLADDQVILDFEKININPDPGLYIALQYLDEHVISSNNFFDPSTNQEVQSVTMLHGIQIDILSFDKTARTRKEEIIMALRSQYAQNAMELNSMNISRLPTSFANASNLEATKILNRFAIRFNVFSLHEKRKDADYFDTFPNTKIKVNAETTNDLTVGTAQAFK